MFILYKTCVLVTLRHSTHYNVSFVIDYYWNMLVEIIAIWSLHGAFRHLQYNRVCTTSKQLKSYVYIEFVKPR